jgi:serine acetyltransferase
VGADAWVNKGCTVGNGSIVAKGAVVTRDVPPHCAAAGTPARVNAENVGWSRSSPARITPQEVERIRRMAQQG